MDNWNHLTVRDYLELGSPRTNTQWIGNMIGLDPHGNRFRVLFYCEGGICEVFFDESL